MYGRRQTRELDGTTYAPGARFRVIKAGARLHGWTPVRGGANGWSQELAVGDVITCTGFGPGMGSDPGHGVEFTSDAVTADGAFHVDFFPQVGGIWAYRPAPGYLEAIPAE